MMFGNSIPGRMVIPQRSQIENVEGLGRFRRNCFALMSQRKLTHAMSGYSRVCQARPLIVAQGGLVNEISSKQFFWFCVTIPSSVVISISMLTIAER